MKNNFKKLIASLMVFATAFTAFITSYAIDIKDTNITVEESTVYEIVNQERKAAGVPTLYYDYALQRAADIRAEEIAIKYSHERPDGTMCETVDDRLDGENIAYGYDTSETAMVGWMNSPAHKTNILDKDFKCMAVGYANVNGTPYWVQLFSCDNPLEPVSVKGEELPDVFYLDPITVTADISTMSYLYVETYNTSGDIISDGKVNITLNDEEISTTVIDEGWVKTADKVDLSKEYIVRVEGYNNAFYSNTVALPESVKAYLYKDGSPTGDIAVLSADNNWTATFDNLIDDGSKYSVRVDNITNYISSTIKDFNGNYKYSAAPSPITVYYYGKKLETVTYTITTGTINTEGYLNVNVLNTDNNPVNGTIEVLLRNNVVSTKELENGKASLKLDLSKSYTINLVDSDLSENYTPVSIPQSYSVDLYKEKQFKETVTLSSENDWTYTFEDYASVNYSINLTEDDTYNTEMIYQGASAIINFNVKDQTINMVKEIKNEDDPSWNPNENPEGNIPELPEEKPVLWVEGTELPDADIIKITIDNNTYNVICYSGTFKEVFDFVKTLGYTEFTIKNAWGTTVYFWYNLSGTTASLVLPEDEAEIVVFTKTLIVEGNSYTIKCASGTYKEVFAFVKDLGYADFGIKDQWGTTVYSWYNVNEDSRCYVF